MDKLMTPGIPSQIDSPAIPTPPADPVPAGDMMRVAQAALAAPWAADLALQGKPGAAEKVRPRASERMTHG